jgi:hypothetical protein
MNEPAHYGWFRPPGGEWKRVVFGASAKECRDRLFTYSVEWYERRWRNCPAVDTLLRQVTHGQVGKRRPRPDVEVLKAGILPRGMVPSPAPMEYPLSTEAMLLRMRNGLPPMPETPAAPVLTPTSKPEKVSA